MKLTLQRFNNLLIPYKMRNEFLLYSTSTILLQSSKLVTTLIVANMIGPLNNGWWNSLQPLLVYGTMLNLGVFNGMNRDVPYFVGKGDHDKSEYIRRVTWGVALITAFLAMVILFVATQFVRNNPIVESVLPFLALALLFQYWFLYESMLLSSAIKFKLLSLQQFTQAILFPLLSIWMTRVWGLNGFVMAIALVNLSVSVQMTWLSGFDLKPIFDIKETRRLIKVGFPIMAGGFLYDVLRTLDRWVILTFLGPIQVGYYTISILVLQAAALLPSIVTAQFYPRMSKLFGETQTYKSVQPIVFRTFQASVLLIVPFCLIVYFGIKPFTETFLPEFVPGIAAAIITVIGIAISRPLTSASSAFLNAVGKARWYMRTQGVIILIQVILTIFLVNITGDLSGIAWGVTTTQIINMLIIVSLVFILLRRNGPEPTEI